MPEVSSANNAVTPRHLWIIGVIALLWSAMGAMAQRGVLR